MSINKCKFEYPAYNYKCDRDALPNSNYCLFHDEEYWKDHEDEVRDKFYKLVDDAIRYSKPLNCIGFNLPYVWL